MTEMSKKEIEVFLIQGTLTGKLATIKKDGSPHLVPIWFIIDKSNDKSNIVFTTSSTSVKAKNIQRDNRVSICVDDQKPPFSFVMIYGIAKIHHCDKNEFFKWATKIAERYVGKSNANAYGKRNSTEGEVLVLINPTKIIAEKDIASWD